MFSDTIIITAEVVEEFLLLPMLIRFFHVLSDILIEGFNRKFHFRGCISLGEYYHTTELIIGPAVDEAAQYHTMPEWIGISAAPSANTFLKKIIDEVSTDVNSMIMRDFILEYYKVRDIPIKGGIERKGVALNWMIRVGANEDKGSKTKPEEIRNKILKNCESSDVNVALKWRNTLEFFDALSTRQLD